MGARRCGVSRLCAELAKCVDSRKNGRTFPLPIAGWSSLVARQAHNLKVAGSNPAPAPNLKPPEHFRGFLIERLGRLNCARIESPVPPAEVSWSKMRASFQQRA